MFDAIRKATNPRIRVLAKWLRIMAWVQLALLVINLLGFFNGREFTPFGYFQLFLNAAFPLWIFWWFRFIK